MSGPLIPYVNAPEIPLGFLTKIPSNVLCAVAGAVVGSIVGGFFTAPAEEGGPDKPRARLPVATFALALVGAVIGFMVAPAELFDAVHPPSIKPFGTLVALGVYLGSVVATRHARERGLDLKKMNEFIFWVVGWGFVGGHVLDAIFYHPDHVAKDPFYLFLLWEGLSSYGGFIGALLGALAFRHFKKTKILSYCESVCSAFPLAWVFGRAGCASVHDHPGRLSDLWFAVRFPAPGGGFVGRFDLGLIECLLTIPLAIAYAILWRRGRRGDGFFIGWMCIAYAPVRFVLDFLRETEGNGISGADPRYGGLTPAQWACFGLLALGIYFVRLSYRAPAPDVAASPAVDEDPDADSERSEEEPVIAPPPVAKKRKRRPRRVDEA